MQKVSAAIFITLLLLTGTVWSQTSDDQSATESVQQQQSPASGAVPAGGQDQAPSLSSDFPPLSGLDEGTLEPNIAARSFLRFAAQAGETATTNAGNNLNGGTKITGI